MLNPTLKNLSKKHTLLAFWHEVFKNFDDLSYEDFLLCINVCLDTIVDDMAENAVLRIADREDRLTDEIKINLRRLNLFDSVEHDAQTGGHTDLVVKLGRFVWKGECKILGGRNNYANDWIEKGFSALSEKYTSGSQFDSHGALFIYIKKENAKAAMELWKNYLSDKLQENGLVYTYTNCETNNLAFYSSINHKKSGLSYCIRHIPVLLYDPTKTIKQH